MPQSKTFGEENNCMGVWKSSKNENGDPTSEFHVKSNWVAVPIKEVTNGHIWKVTTFPHAIQGYCYVPANADRDEFVNWCKKEFAFYAHAGGNVDDVPLANGALWCSVEKSMFKSEMGSKINHFSQSTDYAIGRTTSILGRSPESTIWVLSREVQINSDGTIIPVKDHRYFYFPKKAGWKLSVSKEQSPRYMRVIERHLDNIFCDEKSGSAYLGIGAIVMAMHASYVSAVFDGCPQVCLLGEPGRGKTTILRTAQGMLGMQHIGFVKQISREGLISRANSTTMGVHVDDQKTLKTITESVVDFYNLAKSETYDRGTEEIRCGLVFTSNTKLTDCTDRELRRVVYICFPGESLGARSPEHLEAYVSLKRLRDNGSLSKVCGPLIAVGQQFTDGGWQDIVNNIIPMVSEGLEGALPDVFLSYSILLWFTFKVYSLGIDDPDEVKRRETFIFSHFMNHQAPLIKDYQPSKSVGEASCNGSNKSKGVLDFFREDIFKLLKEGREMISSLLKHGTYHDSNKDLIKSLIVHPAFFKRSSVYRQADVNQHLKQSSKGSGKCMSRRFPNEEKSVACTSANLSLFTKAEWEEILKVIPERQTKTAFNSKKSPGAEKESNPVQDSQHDSANEMYSDESDKETSTGMTIIPERQRNTAFNSKKSPGAEKESNPVQGKEKDNPPLGESTDGCYHSSGEVGAVAANPQPKISNTWVRKGKKRSKHSKSKAATLGFSKVPKQSKSGNNVD